MFTTNIHEIAEVRLYRRTLSDGTHLIQQVLFDKTGRRLGEVALFGSSISIKEDDHA